MVEQSIRRDFGLVLARPEAPCSGQRLRPRLCGSRAQPQERPASAAAPTSSAPPGQGAGSAAPAPVAAASPGVAAAGAAGPGASPAQGVPTPPGGQRPGTGRLGAEAAEGAERVEGRPEALAVGQRGPGCGPGPCEGLPAGVELRIDGHALRRARRSAVATRRGAACGPSWTAGLPADAGEAHDSARSRAVRAVRRAARGVPGERVPRSQARLGVPGPEATPGDQSAQVGEGAYGVLAPREPEAAQGARRCHDDTAGRLVSVSTAHHDRLAAAQAPGVAPPHARPGMPTTAVAVQVGAPPGMLSAARRRPAGEHLPRLRDTRAVGRDKPWGMSEALSRNAGAEASRRRRGHGLAHGRRTGSALAARGPHACQVVRPGIRQGCAHDAPARPESAASRGAFGVPPGAEPAAAGRTPTVARHAAGRSRGGTPPLPGHSQGREAHALANVHALVLAPRGASGHPSGRAGLAAVQSAAHTRPG